MSAAWISRTRSGFIACWPFGFLAALLFFEVLPLAVRWLDPALPDFCGRACAMPDISSASPRHRTVMRSRWFTEHLSKRPEATDSSQQSGARQASMVETAEPTAFHSGLDADSRVHAA